MEVYLRENALGRVFACRHSYRQPSVVQVVGWTKNTAKESAKVRYVYVRYVALEILWDDAQFGGTAKIDINDIKAIDTPTYKPGHERLTLSLPDENDKCGPSLFAAIRQEYYVMLKEGDYDHRYTWCSY